MSGQVPIIIENGRGCIYIGGVKYFNDDLQDYKFDEKWGGRYNVTLKNGIRLEYNEQKNLKGGTVPSVHVKDESNDVTSVFNMDKLKIYGSVGNDNICIWGCTHTTVDTKGDSRQDNVYVRDSKQRKSNFINLKGDKNDRLIDKR